MLIFLQLKNREFKGRENSISKRVPETGRVSYVYFISIGLLRGFLSWVIKQGFMPFFHSQTTKNRFLESQRHQNLMKKTVLILRWVAGVALALSAVILIASTPFAGILLLISSILLIPPTEQWVSQKVPLSRNIKIVVILMCFIIGCILIPAKRNNASANTDKEEIPEHSSDKYDAYNSSVRNDITALSAGQKAQRDSLHAILKSNQTYKDLVENKSVNQKYFPVLEAIGEVLASWDASGYSVTEEVSNKIQSDKDQLRFTMLTAMMVVRGGLPPELVEVLDRYRSKYGLYQSKGTILYDAEGKGNKLQNSLNLVVAFGVIDSKNHQVLDGLSEAALEGIHEWRNAKSETTNPYTYLYDKRAFNTFLKENYPQSKYILSYDAEISAEKLFSAYDANEVAADNNYKGKQLLITGTVNEISKDFTDAIIVQLDGGGYIQEVWCYFDDAKAAANLSKGDRISVIGKCDGFVMKNVIVKDCKLAE